MFLRLCSPSVAVLCLDGLIDLGDISPQLRATIESVCNRLEQVLAVTYRRKKEAEEWLELNPLSIDITQVVSKTGAWQPPPIQEGVNAAGRTACECVAICSDALEVSQAHIVGVGAILVTNQPDGPVPHDQPYIAGPDFILHAGQDGARVFDTDKRFGGYVGEVLAAIGHVPWIDSAWHKGRMTACTITFENEEACDSPVHVCGRYFRRSDPRHALHPLSLRLVNAKRYPERQARLLAGTLRFWANVCEPGECIVTCIPPRPDDDQNVVSLALQELTVDNLEANPSLLVCKRDYPKQKDAGSYASRRENVRGVLGVNGPVSGTVVVVDDITTSFATLNEARCALLDAGANDVMLVAACFHPENLAAGPATAAPSCPTCEGDTQPRFRKKDGGIFWGCSDLSVLQRGERHDAVDFKRFYSQAILEKPSS